MKSGKYRITRKGGIGLRRRRKPPHWSGRFPAGVRPGVADMPPDGGQEPQDGAEEQGGPADLWPAPENASGPRNSRPRPRNYDLLKPTDEGR